MRTAGTGYSWLHRRTLPNVMFLESYPDICCSQSYPVGKSCIHSYQGMIQQIHMLNPIDMQSFVLIVQCLVCFIRFWPWASVATEVGITVDTRRRSAVSRESSSFFLIGYSWMLHQKTGTQNWAFCTGLWQRKVIAAKNTLHISRNVCMPHMPSEMIISLTITHIYRFDPWNHFRVR